MKKILRLIPVIALILGLVLVPMKSRALDFGDFSGDSDYGGGWDSGGWDSGGWDDDDDYSYSGGSYSGSSSDGGDLLFIIIIVGAIIIINLVKGASSKGTPPRQNVYRQPQCLRFRL